MKKLFIILTIMLGSLYAYSQNKLNAGAGLTLNTGLVTEFELEKYYSDNFSLPLRGNLGFFFTEDYNALTIDIHKGFRQYLKSGFFTEQWLGIGGIASFYKIESIWYYDNYGNVTRYKDGANWGIMPSVTLGIGYNITHKKEKKNLIWVRPKVFWNLGFRGLNLPYASLQIGYTFNIN
jgi:hypothetical protein